MRTIVVVLIVICSLGGIHKAEGQILNRIKKRIENKVERKVDRKVDEKVDDVLNPDKKKKNDGPATSTKDPDKNSAPSSAEGAVANEEAPKIGFWMSYDFIPGNNVIFYDNMNEEDYGDFPRRWDLLGGNAEVARYGEERVLLFYNNVTNIKPLFDSDDYLPENFSIEFDIYFDELAKGRRTNYSIYFNEDRYNPIRVGSYYPFEVEYKTFKYSSRRYEEAEDFHGWHHIAISYSKGYLKMYFDEQKVLNIPRLDFKPAMISKIRIDFSEDQEQQRVVSMKNFKIAEGGGKPYAQVIADGKFVSHGILFDTGKATLQPQSSGVLKKVTDMLIDNPDWKFEIVGHTDSDGENQANKVLSEQRAEAVKQALVKREIDPSRLNTSGKGESQPLNTNSSPEEKANNRRVEFILEK